MVVLEFWLVILDLVLLAILSALICFAVDKWQKPTPVNPPNYGRFVGRSQNGLVLLYDDGTPIRCPVCSLTIKDNDDVENTPCCQTPCHRDHLREYIHVKSKCPYCGTALVVSRFSGQLEE